MFRQLKIGFRMMLVMTVLTGLMYPDLVTGLAQWLYPAQANGSLVLRDGRVIGSSLIGQAFSRPDYFYPRPSAVNYDASLSGGSNLGPTSEVLVNRVKTDAEKFRTENPEWTGPFPADLLTASGSGLDPHISPASAQTQAARVAKARRVTVAQIEELIHRCTEPRGLGILGERRVNVLMLNLALDQRFPSPVAGKN
jgi:K+-transporting ATPase ATPase C chain